MSIWPFHSGPASWGVEVTVTKIGLLSTLLHRVAQGHGAQVQMELRRRFRGEPDTSSDSRPRHRVAELPDAAAEARHER
jgi:hypothetical protein